MLPQAKISFEDGNLGVVSAGAGKTQLLVGISAKGTPNTVQICNSSGTARTLLKAGPLFDAVFSRVKGSGATMLAVPCEIGTHGSVGAWTQQGTGAGAVSATAAPFEQILAKVVTPGVLGTAAFQFSVNGGAYSATVLSTVTSFPYRVPGTLATITFAAGTYRADDLYTVATTGVVTRTAGAPDVVTCAASPVDAYRLQVEIVVEGARGTSQFTYSLDGGNTKSAPITTAATVVIPGAGVVLAFTNASYAKGDIYTATATAAAFTTGAAQAAIEAALAGSDAFEGIEVVGMPSNASDAAAMAAMLDTEVQAAETEQQIFLFGLVSCPTVEADATVKAAFATFTSATGRVSVCVGTCDVVSASSGLIMRRPISWPYGTRLASTRRCVHPGEVMMGGLTGVRAIQAAAGGAPTADTFDADRFVTLRTFRIPGVYVTRGNTMALVTSDYNSIMNVRVANRAATVAQESLLLYVNANWRIDPDTGALDARDANAVEGKITTQLQTQLIGEQGSAKDEASAVSFVLDPDNNLLTDKTLTGEVGVIPKGYSEFIYARLGFVNPRLA